jgi:hypothetical protein
MKKETIITPNRRYRYQLYRKTAAADKKVCFIMLNPSTADEEEDDHTIRHCIDFARRLGYGELYAVNLYAWRARDPRELVKPPHENRIGPENDSFIKRCARNCDLTVVAWGALKDPVQQSRAKLVTGWLSDPKALVLTKDGHPRHPLTLPRDSELSDFPGYG